MALKKNTDPVVFQGKGWVVKATDDMSVLLETGKQRLWSWALKSQQ